MRGLLLLAALGAFNSPADPPSFLVSDIRRRGDAKPTGRIRIWRLRGATWTRTDPVDAVSVEWDRLADNDRIEVLS
jgi:hypothetical protein